MEHKNNPKVFSLLNDKDNIMNSTNIEDIEVLKLALKDLLDGNYMWWDIQEHTGESEERCKEIQQIAEKLFSEEP